VAAEADPAILSGADLSHFQQVSIKTICLFCRLLIKESSYSEAVQYYSVDKKQDNLIQSEFILDDMQIYLTYTSSYKII